MTGPRCRPRMAWADRGSRSRPHLTATFMTCTVAKHAISGPRPPGASPIRMGVLAACAFLGCGCTASHETAEGRHVFAIARLPLRDVPLRDDGSNEVAASFRCPIGGEYFVSVLYDRDLTGIEAAFPRLNRAFAETVASAMNVSLTASIAVGQSGRTVRPEARAPTVCDASTRTRKWSEDRLSCFRLEGDATYRMSVAIERQSHEWRSLDPVVVVAPSPPLVKTFAWRSMLGLSPR